MLCKDLFVISVCPWEVITCGPSYFAILHVTPLNVNLNDLCMAIILVKKCLRSLHTVNVLRTLGKMFFSDGLALLFAF